MSTTGTRGAPRAGSVERISAGDALQLATDVGPVPMNIGAVLTLGPGTTVSDVVRTLQRRAGTIRRLRQVLVRPPPGLGRPYWTDAAAFDARSHVTTQDGLGPGEVDMDALLAIAVDAVTRPLTRALPLWRAVVLGRQDGQAVAVVVVLHHVLTDGIGGLTVLDQLVDGDGPATRAPGASRGARPGIPDLLSDRLRELARSVWGVRSTLSSMRQGGAELGPRRGRRAPTISLNRPTGHRRRISAVTVDVKSVHAAARKNGATVNDAVLVAVTGAMAEVLRMRGEHVRELVVSVPVSARARTTVGELGNQVGVMPVRVPLSGSATERLEAVARLTRVQKTRTRGASAALIGPAFRLVAATGLFTRFINRQRLVNSFLTNLPGPRRELTLAGAPIRGIVPVTTTAGNVGVSFAALSYAGSLTVVAMTDPDVVPELGLIVTSLRRELRALVAEVAVPGDAERDRESRGDQGP
ncbi:WS/DGAT domain-containing protein [Knoellia locipacati]|uniref:wax ester/triacylglycerol synthase domain-containing protein n=1 Tax=Knoellia locipacati TaxID=882824 RepID=UPI00384C8EDB